MLKSAEKIFAVIAIIATLTISVLPAVQAKTVQQEPSESRQVDLVIALDVSGSMSGLIESAKQRLWDIVNELGRAQPTPDLRVAILSYGNPIYGLNTGYVRVDQPFTKDLDAVNETLFAFSTNGGDEYVASVIDKSVRALQWSAQPDALRIIFVAGNESATQDPQIPIETAIKAAVEQAIVVNTIYCGRDTDNVTAGWRKVATLADGLYASIDQNTAAVANIATPMDAELATLNEELNKTYVAFGPKGKRYRANQAAQDKNAAEMSAPAAASRVVTKASPLYNSANWDLVDALKSGRRLDEFERTDLPEEMRAMGLEKQRDYVSKQAERREELQRQITKLDKERREYAAQKRKEAQNNSAKGLDEVITEGLRSVAEKKGFTFQ